MSSPGYTTWLPSFKVFGNLMVNVRVLMRVSIRWLKLDSLFYEVIMNFVSYLAR